MRIMRCSVLLSISVVWLATPADAAVKAYDSSKNNGTPSDFFNGASNTCPPVATRLDFYEGRQILTDDGLGTVTLTDFAMEVTDLVDFGPDVLATIYGPGSFVFVSVAQTRSLTPGQTSNTTGIGAHGPSGTDPGETTEWGILTGWQMTGTTFCLASPTVICDNAGFAHAQTIPAVIESPTYDLGTWSFDAVGDMESTLFIYRTSNGGLANNSALLRGAFQGASLPALPVLGFVGLAVALGVTGVRSLARRR